MSSPSIRPAPPLSPFKSLGLRWEVLDDDVQSCRYEILKYKHMKRHDYFPGIDTADFPECYADLTTTEEWDQKIAEINKEIVKWWAPGNHARNASYILGTVCLVIPCLVVYCALDEVGYFCFVNRKRKQLRDLLGPICEKLSDEKLKWAVEYKRRPGDEAKGPDNEQSENSKAVYIVISRRDAVPRQATMVREGPKTPPDTVRVSEDDESDKADRMLHVSSASSGTAGARSKPTTPMHSVHPAPVAGSEQGQHCPPRQQSPLVPQLDLQGPPSSCVESKGEREMTPGAAEHPSPDTVYPMEAMPPPEDSVLGMDGPEPSIFDLDAVDDMIRQASHSFDLTAEEEGGDTIAVRARSESAAIEEQEAGNVLSALHEMLATSGHFVPPSEPVDASQPNYFDIADSVMSMDHVREVRQDIARLEASLPAAQQPVAAASLPAEEESPPTLDIPAHLHDDYNTQDR